MELKHVFPAMLESADRFPEYQVLIAGAPNFTPDDYAPYLADRKLPIVFNATYDLLKNAKAALVTSGTATLETALLNCPQVVLYRGNSISVFIARLLVKIRFISLVNLIMDREVVKELIQEAAHPDQVADELNAIINNSASSKQMLQDYKELAQKVGPAGASERTAALIQKYLRKSD
jgi:lipid-A-disaccharide synthase